MTLPTKMSGIVLTGHGGAEKLEWREALAVPVLTATDVVICVADAGVNNTDINTRTESYSKGNAETNDAAWNGNSLILPRIHGADVCSEIVAVGDAVDTASLGERVLIEPCIQKPMEWN